MDNDDRQIGRILSRREVLALLGTAGATLLVGCGTSPSGSGATAAPTAAAASTAPTTAPTPAAVATPEATNVATAASGCVVRPEMTEGPYFVDEQLDRSDIRAEPSTGEVKAGVPLVVAFNVSQVSNGSCSPLAGVVVDVWHCDALGVYSAVADMNTVGQKFLRGYQTTNANGKVQFTSIYPGWYQGRTVHFHFKIRTDPASDQGYEFTSQLYFDDALTEQVFAQQPYAGKQGKRDTTNATDMHYANGGDQLLLTLAAANGGYAGAIDIALDLSDTATGADDSFQQGGCPGGPPPGGRATQTP